MKDCLLTLDSGLLDKIKSLCTGMPLRHSRFQLEHFVVCQKKWTPDIQYKQCLRELNARYDVLKEKQFEYRDLSLKAEELRLLSEQEKERSEKFTLRIEHAIAENKIQQYLNQVDTIEFRLSNLENDVADVARECKILLELADSLQRQRRFTDFDQADEDYWKQFESISPALLPENE